MELNERDHRLVAALQAGLPLTPAPYADIGARLGWSEAEVIAGVARLQALGCVNRLGVVVRHHELGYRANAMVVFDVGDDDVDAAGRRLAALSFVTLCYRRARAPGWPYNLYCMVHGKARDEVLALVAELRTQLPGAPSEVLFSRRRFTQRGARYGEQERTHGRA